MLSNQSVNGGADQSHPLEVPRRLALTLSALLFLGCGIFDDPKSDPTLAPGLYEYKENFLFQGIFVEMVFQSHLSDNATYSGGVYLNTQLAIQTKGKWKLQGDKFITTENLARKLNAAGTFGPWETEPGSEASIRGITATGFQLYMPPESVIPEFQGWVGGWKSYIRIGD